MTLSSNGKFHFLTISVIKFVIALIAFKLTAL